jgi:DNA-binding MarR family transcriptional regulator
VTSASPQGGDIPPEHGISVLYDCFLLTQRLRPVLARGLEGAPLRGDEYAVYSLLAEQGPLSPTVLARRTGMPATTMSDYVRSMTQRGHLTRERDPRDARAALLQLTADGRAAWAETSQRFSQVAAEVERALGPHEGPVRSALARLTRVLAEVAETAPAHTTDP